MRGSVCMEAGLARGCGGKDAKFPEKKFFLEFCVVPC